MKHATLTNIGWSLVLVAGMGAYSVASAHEGEKHDAAAAKDEQQIPATADGVWQAIDQKTAELDKIIQSGALDQVHHHAFAIRDLAAALPERSQSLPADKLAKVKGNVRFVATLAARLDATGDAKDKTGTQANFEKLEKVLDGMRANYSAAKTQ